MHERANYYVILGLDPGVSDPAVIAAAIEDGRRRWSGESSKGSVAARRKAQLYLEQLPEIKRVMSDASERREEADQARKLQDVQRQTRLRALDASIAVVRADGPASSRERAAQLVKEFGESFSEAEILARIRAAGVVIEEPSQKTPSAADAKPRLDPARVARLRPSLEVLGVENLYALLGMTPVSSPRALFDRADEMLKEILRIGHTDAKSTARKDLCGEALVLFASDAEKQKYDSALAVEPMEQLRPSIEMAGASGILSTDVQDVLLRQARELGVDAAAARDYLDLYARKRKWRLQQAARLPSEELRQCGYCFALEKDSRAQNCRRCGEPLVVACPRCDATMPTTHAACTACGYRVGDAPVVKALLRDGKQRAIAGEFLAALALIDRALLYWPGWQEALEARGEVASRRAARDAALGEIEALVRARKFVEGRAALARMRRAHGATGTEALERQVTDALARAEALEREGDALRAAGRNDDAIARYEQALEHCADLPRAHAAIAAFPPPPPSNLRAEPLRAGFRLAWKPSSARGAVRYAVVRGTKGRPRDRDDGAVVATVDDQQLDDLGAPVGTPVYYAVFAVRGDVCSRESAAAGPLLLTAEISAPQVLAGDNEITLRWQRPPGSTRVEVWRSAGAAPARRGEGAQLTPSDSGVQDAGVRNGERYGYRVVAVFDDPATPGLERFTTGVLLSAIPAAPPPPVLDLRTERHGKRFILTWTPPAGAAVQIRRAAQPPDVPPGAVVPLDALDRFGTLMDARGSGRAEWEVDAQGQLAFVPITVGRSSAVIGKPVLTVTVDDVTNVRAKTNGRDIVLTWDWPAGADEVVVCSANDRYPALADEPGVTCTRVTRAAYRRTNGFELRVAKQERHFFTLFVRAAAGTFFSAGASVFESMGQGTVVRYRVSLKKSGFLARSVAAAWVELECDEPIPSLPALIVLGKEGRQPLSPADGALLAEEPELHFAEGRARIALPAERATRSTYVKVFFKDGRHAQQIRLQPASGELLRLG